MRESPSCLSDRFLLRRFGSFNWRQFEEFFTIIFTQTMIQVMTCIEGITERSSHSGRLCRAPLLSACRSLLANVYASAFVFPAVTIGVVPAGASTGKSESTWRFSRASARSSLRIDVCAWKNLMPASVQTRRILTRQKQRRSHKHMSALHVDSRGKSGTLKGKERDYTGVRYDYFSPCRGVMMTKTFMLTTFNYY